jgi:hypothetical protein
MLLLELPAEEAVLGAPLRTQQIEVPVETVVDGRRRGDSMLHRHDCLAFRVRFDAKHVRSMRQHVVGIEAGKEQVSGGMPGRAVGTVVICL